MSTTNDGDKRIRLLCLASLGNFIQSYQSLTSNDSISFYCENTHNIQYNGYAFRNGF